MPNSPIRVQTEFEIVLGRYSPSHHFKPGLDLTPTITTHPDNTTE